MPDIGAQREPAAPPRRWHFANAELDERSLVLKVGGRIVAIEPKPLEVLLCLLERAGEVLTKDALMQAAWPGRIITDATLAKTINRLRETLGDTDQSVVKTHHRYGYRLLAPVRMERIERGASEQAEARPASRGETEHRPLTVLFCDGVESTQLADSLDPEAFRDLLLGFQQRAAAICARYEGHVAQQVGEGLLMFFGYPAAHDDDAERALRCACDLLAAPASIGPRLALRIGVHSGTVLIGCTGKNGEPLATGATLHLASRLQALAEPDTVLVSEATFRLVPGLFVTRAFGPQAIRGLSEPVNVYQVVQPSGVRSRLEAAPRLTPYSGREHEIGALHADWQAARRGEGRAVLISGEPGLGKSRLLLELRERLSGSAYTWLECRASALSRHSAFQPWIELLQRGLGLRESDPVPQRLARLAQGLDALGLDLAATVPLLAPLLGIELAAPYVPAQYGPELRRKRTLEALASWVLHLAQQQPLMLVFEDLHWADDSTLDGLGLLLKQLTDMPVLLLMSARTEFVPRWLQHRWLRFQTLDPLPPADVERMLDTLGDQGAVPPALRALVLQRAGGVPLFVEELSRALIESGAPNLHSIPTSLRALLMARLDRLGPARELIQTAAVVGREVAHRLLAPVSGLDAASLDAALRRLLASGLLHARGAGAAATYVFKHALIQDAAYDILLKPRRQELHGRIARTLEATFPERVRNEPEVLAQHFEKAGLIEAAARYGGLAAHRAITASSYAEAIRHAEHALQLLRGIAEPNTPLELRLLVDLGSAKLALLGRGHPELLPILSRTQTLCGDADDTQLRAQALANIAWMQAGFGNYAELSGAASDLVELARKTGDKAHEGAGHVLVAQASYIVGDQIGGRRHAGRALQMFPDQPSAEVERLLGYDGPAAALSVAAITLWQLGYPDLSWSRLAEAQTRAESVGHQVTQCAIQSRMAWIRIWRREPHLALEHVQAASSRAERNGFDWWQAFTMLQEGMALGMQGRFDDGLGLIRCYLRSEGSDRVLYQALARGFEAQLCLWSGRLDEARASLEAGFDAAQRYDERHWEAELHRLCGALRLAQRPGDSTSAEACFLQALHVARTQQARSLELRAATSLARLWQRQGRGQEADAVLRPVYEWFTEGFDTADLRDAAAVLGSTRDPTETARWIPRTPAPSGEDTEVRARALANLALMQGGIGDYAGYQRTGRALIALGDQVGNPSWEGCGHVLMSQAIHMTGAVAQSNQHTESALRAFGRASSRDAQQAHRLLGIDGPSAAMLINATALWVLGHPDQALARNEQGWQRAESTGHPQSISSARSRRAWAHLYRREPQPALEFARDAVEYADRYGYADWKQFALLQEGIALGLLGHLDQALSLIRRHHSPEGVRRTLYAAHSRGFEAQFCLSAGQPAAARAAVEAAFEWSAQCNERHWDAELHRLHGECLLAEHPDNAAAAESCFQKALEISRSQQARSLQLRAATSLASLWQQQGRSADADALLRPVYGWFTEGFATPDLIEAAARLIPASEASQE